jgi:uncharacterized repeat protein (TIGR04138 family)
MTSRLAPSSHQQGPVESHHSPVPAAETAAVGGLLYCFASRSPRCFEDLMPHVDPAHPLAQLLQRDHRYKLDAYLFVLESLAFGQENLGMGAEPPAEELESAGGQPEQGVRGKGRGRPRRRQAERHVSGQELCEAARQYALQQYGFLAPTVLGTWGVQPRAISARSCSA